MTEPQNPNFLQEHNRPNTPGTPGTFDTRYSGNFQDNTAFASQYDPHNRALSPSPLQDSNKNTYYFEKNGGAAATEAGAAGGAGAAAGNGASRGGIVGWIKRHPFITGLVALVIVGAVVGGAVGGAVGSHKTNDIANGSHDNASGSSSKGGSSNSGSNSGTNGSGSGSTSSKPITPLPKWNLTDPESKMVGVSIGNWLVLERWLSEDWFVSEVGNGPIWDEWGFTQTLGNDKALSALQQHWNTWINESDFDTMKSVGINTVRIPVGYWAFVDTAQGEPYLSKAGQTDQLQKVLGWLYDRGMYAFIDLHGMPGSQNGDQSSGHNGTINWFNSEYFGYSYNVLNATIDWVKASNYSSVVHSICPVNEPRPGTDSGKLSQLTSYYETSYNLLKNAGFIMQFHHGFLNNPFQAWADFATGKDPNYIAFNNNPYPGWFPSNPNANNIISQVCTIAQESSQFPVPVVQTEFSLANGVGTSSFNTEFYNTEVSGYSWSAGSIFWTWKALHSSNPIQAEPNNIMDLYSLGTMIQEGVVQKVNPSAKPLDTVKSLPNQQCGTIPTVTWSNPSGNTQTSKKRSFAGKRMTSSH
ncbi:glycoside hydrolase [Meira miltonrushii]|uniref:glucan 1,3-beta-glucosidase n=1 Tax=Meira miltonrushii TaxID=1280837 RepID=A0A316V4V2_9BASI|nr:glycoside hydrolase [Meira miltonrushii]PWN32599.1 glycoside hydrolase [Meira miltonrushii]